MLWLKLIRDFLKVLRDGQSPGQIAGGFALGSFLGLSPMFTLQGALVWFILLLLDVNLSAALVAMSLFALVAYLGDPVFHWLGFQILVNVDALTPTWTWLYNAPIAPLSRFYNTVVMGSVCASLVLFLPVYLTMKRFVVAYRTHVHSRVERWKIYKVLHRSTLFQWYQRIRDLKG
jgi:uncharacterized protein (TIGR03546 family)